METKKIIITGGATRIGRSIALELANYNTEIVIHYFKSFSEAKRLKIPVVSCVDSYAPNVEIEYPIPVNVNSKAFFHFLCHILVKIRNNS